MTARDAGSVYELTHLFPRLLGPAWDKLSAAVLRLHPAPGGGGDRIARLLADLDSDTFDVREKASKELEKLAKSAKVALRKALDKSPSPEVRRRIRQLLAKLDAGAPSGGRLRELRALEALELIGTPEARQLLRRLAGGAPDARLTREAKATLDRLTRR